MTSNPSAISSWLVPQSDMNQKPTSRENIQIVNDKPIPVTIEMRQGPMYEFEELRVKQASLAPHRKAGDYAWRISIPAHGEARLSYVISGRPPDDD